MGSDYKRLTIILLGLPFWFLVATVCDARHTPWAAGSEYVYRLHTLSVSDIPELGSQAAGIKLEAQMIVHCRDAGSIVVKLVNVTAWKYHADVGDSWSELDSGQLGTRVNVEGKHFLEKPFIVRHREGLVDSLVVSQDEPLWTINMKKALASKLQLHVSGTRSIESATRNFGLPSEDTIEDINDVFKVFEGGVTGECETLYEIAPLSDALIRSDGKLNPLPKLCSEGTFFQVVKTKDYSKCRSNKPVYNVIAPSGWRCKPGNSVCGTARSRSSVSRYIACGSLESFTLLKATHQGELRTSPYAYDTEQLRALSLMKMTLQAVRSSPAWLARDLDAGLTISSLVFSFPGESPSGSSWLTDGLMRMPPLRDADHLHQVQSERSNLHAEIDRLLSKAVDHMDENQEETAIDTIASLSFLIRHLDFQEINNLVGDIDRRSPLERTILLDAIMAAGSNPAVMYLKDSILNQRLNRAEILQAIAGFPLYIRTPTLELFGELFSLLKALGTLPPSERSLYHSAMLSLSQLVHTSCVNVTEARTRFPGALYGDFCSPNEPFIENKLIPLLSREVSGTGPIEDKIVALTALGEIGHPSIIKVVLPIIKAKGDHSPLVRTKAVISLHKMAHNSNEEVVNILSTTFQNPMESSEVRMAAFTLLILANPPAYRWQRIAVSTWFEQSAQVASFVYTTLYSLAKDIQPLENLKEASEKAQIVLPLAKRVPLGLKYSYNWKGSHLLVERNAGIEFHSEMFNSEESIFPKSLYGRLSWALGPYHFDVFELESYGENWKSAWDRIVSKLSSPEFGSDAAHQKHIRIIREFDLHPDLRRIKKQLNAKSPIPAQDAGSADAFFHVSLMKAIHRLTSFDEAGVTDLIQKILSTGDVSFQRDFAHRKWMPLIHAEILVPNTMGFMTTTRAQVQVLSSFKGNIQVKSGAKSDFFESSKSHSAVSSSRNVRVEVDIKPTVVVKLISSMDVGLEVAKSLSVSGVDTHLSLSLPGQFTADIELDNWKVMLAWKPVSLGSSGLSSLFHYRVRPFTALQSVDYALPFTASPGESKDIRAAEVTPQTHQYPMGGKTGLKLNYFAYSELPAASNRRSMWQDSPMRLLTTANFAILPSSLHRRSYRITLDPMGSETKRMVFSLNVDAADKLDRGTQVYSAGSKSPAAIKEPVNRIRYLSSNIDPLIKQKLIKVLGPVPRGSAIHVDAKMTMEKAGAPSKDYGASFSGAYGTDGTKLAVNAQLELPLSQVSDPFTLCIEGGGQYPRFQSLDRRNLMETPLEAVWNAKIGFGDSCIDHEININAELKRSDNFARHVQESAENRECIMHEARGEFSHEQCLAAKELATVLDEYDINIKYGHVLPVLLNASLSVEDWLKSHFYSQLSENRVNVNNPDRTLRILARVKPSLSAVDLMLFKPRSNTFFHDLHISPMTNAFIFPLSAKSSLSERLVDNTISDGFSPICRLERNSITTFDKVQYNAQISDCDHVVLTAPSIENLAVLIRQEGDNKVVSLLVGRDKVQVSAATLAIRYNDMEVTVTEDQPLEVHHAEYSGNQNEIEQGPSIGIYKIGPAAFKLSAQKFGINIVTDASNSITIKAPRFLQGKMIGLCGNMDGETVQELRDPQRCILSSGAIMAASYLLTDNQKCSGLGDKLRAQLREEQNVCLNKHDVTLNPSIEQPPTVGIRHSSAAGSSSNPVVNGNDCTIRRTIVLVRNFDDAKCFSTSTVKECRSSCHGQHFRPTNIGFHCVTNSKLADELEQEAKHKPLTFMIGKKENIRTTRYLPTACRLGSHATDSN